MRTRPKPRPSPLVVRNRLPTFSIFFRGGEVGKGDVQLGALHIHVYPDQAPIFRQGQAGLDGVVKEVAENAAQVQLRHLQFHRDVGVHLDGDALGLGQGGLAVQDRVGHGVAGLHHGVHGVQIRVHWSK